MTKRPGQSTGNSGGIFQEVGPRGGLRPNFVTVPDNTYHYPWCNVETNSHDTQ